MKEHPILFSTQMVKAILEGRKSMTRRTRGLEKINENPDKYHFEGHFSKPFDIPKDWKLIKFPYGEIGDRLWVRETWMRAPNVDFIPNGAFYYKASVSNQFLKKWPKGWKPSIHMPKEACRIWLEITNIRVERLQNITRSDIRAEGLKCPPELLSDDVYPNYRNWYPKAFKELWESINGKGSWDKNPWVWVIEFKRIEHA